MRPTLPTRLGATPGKLALTGFLTLTFAYVLYGSFQSTDAPAQAPQRPVPPAIAASPVLTPSATAATAFVERASWNKLPMDRISRFDPFEAKLPGDQQRSVRTVATLKTHNEDFTLDDIRNAKSAIVLFSGGSKIARYGATELHVGDRVDDYRVRDITPQGVTLAE